MSWGTCYTSSNNIHYDKPPLMSDSRIYTNYEAVQKIDENIAKVNSIKSNADYRKYLINNAESLMKLNHVSMCNNVGSSDFNVDYNRRFTHYNKYLFKSSDDVTQPFGYENSDLKNAYLSKEQLQNRLVAPLMSQQGYLLEEAKRVFDR